jgi:hypothetical protein
LRHSICVILCTFGVTDIILLCGRINDSMRFSKGNTTTYTAFAVYVSTCWNEWFPQQQKQHTNATAIAIATVAYNHTKMVPTVRLSWYSSSRTVSLPSFLSRRVSEVVIGPPQTIYLGILCRTICRHSIFYAHWKSDAFVVLLMNCKEMRVNPFATF